MKEPAPNHQIEHLQQRLTELHQRAAEGSDNRDELMSDVLEELVTTLEELQVADEELRQQNEELAAANQAVEAEHKRYLDLFDLAPDGYIVTDAKGVIREANCAAAAMLNVSQQFLAGKPFFLYLAEGERKNWHPQLAQLTESDRVENWQAVLQPRDGELFYASITVARVRDRDGKPTGLRFLIRDISERKKIGEELDRHRHHLEELVKQRTGELRDSNELLEKIFSDTHVLIAYMDTDFNFIRVNDAYAKADERNPDFFIGKNHFALFPNKENEAIFRRVVETGEPHSVYAKPFEYAEHPERGVSHWDWSLIPVKDASEKVEGALLCLVDVTDRIRAEEEVSRQRERVEATAKAERQRFLDVLETLPAYVVLLTSDYHVPFDNRFFRERFGESHGRCCYDYLFNRTEPCETCETFTVLKTMQPHEWEWLGPDGRNYYIYDFPFIDTDGSTLILEMGIDITEQKQAEETLRNINEILEQRVLEREGQFQLLFSRMNEGFAFHEIICDEKGEPCDYRFLEVNPAFERLTGLKRSDVIGRTVREVLPNIEPYWIETYGKVALTGEPVRFENYSSRLNKDYEVFAFCPSPRQFAVLFSDISARKQFEEALRKSREDLNRAQAVAHTGSWRLDLQKNEFLWSDETYRIFGIPIGTPLTYDAFLGTVHPDDREYVDTKWKAALRGEPYDIEHRIVVGDTVKWVRERAKLEFEKNGELLGSFGTTQDITERKNAAEALKESEARLRLAQVSAGAGMWVWDMSADKLEWSEELFHLYGLDPQKTEASFDSWRSIMYPDDRVLAEKRIEEAIANGTPLANEFRIVLPSGELRWVNALGDTIYDSDGKPQRMSGICIDITERKQAEEKVRESRERLRTALDASGGAIYDHRVPLDESTYHDERWAELLGYNRNELPPHDRFLDWLYERVHPEDLDLLKRTYEDFIEGRSPGYHVEVRLRHKKGHWFWVEGYSHAVERDESGRVRRVVGVMTDITERKQANEKVRDALDESRRHSAETEALLESSHAVLERQSFKKAAQAIFNSCRNLIGATAGYVALLSRDGTRNEVIFLESGDLPCSVDPKIPMPVRGLRAEAYRSGRPVYDNNFADSEWVAFLPPGHARLDNVMFAPLILNGNAVGLMGLANKPGGFTDDDVRLASAFADHASIALQNSLYLGALRSSEAKYRGLSENLDREVKKKVQELKQAESLASIGQMVSVVAHEIRNPLQNIRMGIDAVRKGTKGDKGTGELLEEVDYGINSLNRIVEDLLEYSRPVKLQCSTWAIRDIVEQALHSLSHRLHKTNIRLELEREDGEFFVDAPKMTRALVNLIANAVEAMPDGGDLWIRSKFVESDGARLLNLSISDTGCGIDAEGLERIKEPFFTTKTSGTGLGIHICKKIVDAHNGGFSIKSAVNEGTTVEISLPVGNS